MNESCINESTKHIIEVSNNATTEMLKTVTPDEVDAFQAYTIRNLDSKLSMGSDIQQYRLMSIAEGSSIRCDVFPCAVPHWEVWRVPF